MSIDKKIEDAKNHFKEIQQSGRNKFQNYNYMEVKDIFPVVREVCKKFKIRSKFDWKPEQNIMELTLKDLEDGSVDISTIPVAPVNVGDAGKYMQDIGRCQTYAQRYLYIQVFEIAVPDEIDNKNQHTLKGNVNGTKKVSKTGPVKPIIEPKTEEITEQDIKNILNKVGQLFKEREITPTMEQYQFQIRRQTPNKKLQDLALKMLETQTADKMKQVQP